MSFVNFFFSTSLTNTEVRQLNNVRLVNDAHEQTKQALHQYTLTHYPQNPVSRGWLVLVSILISLTISNSFTAEQIPPTA